MNIINVKYMLYNTLVFVI